MSPFDIYLKKGDIIGQGIIKKYEVTDDDRAEGLRTGGFGSTTQKKEIKINFNSIDDINEAIKKFQEDGLNHLYNFETGM